MTESDVQRQIIEYLWYSGWLVLRVNQGAITQTDSQSGKRRHVKFCTWYALGTDPQSAGVSDILALSPDKRFWVIECKAPGRLSKVTDSQRSFQAEVIKRGGVAVCVDSLDLLIEEIEKR